MLLDSVISRAGLALNDEGRLWMYPPSISPWPAAHTQDLIARNNLLFSRKEYNLRKHGRREPDFPKLHHQPTSPKLQGYGQGFQPPRHPGPRQSEFPSVGPASWQSGQEGCAAANYWLMSRDGCYVTW